MTRARLIMPLDHWPAVDRARWGLAQEPAGFLDGHKPASHWSAGRRAIVEPAYGRWLAFLHRRGALDGPSGPGERVTEARLRAFIIELQNRLAPVSVALVVGALLRMLAVIAPERCWADLAHLYRQLKGTAAPSRHKLGHMVAATDLFALGLRLMETCNEPPQRTRQPSTGTDSSSRS